MHSRKRNTSITFQIRNVTFIHLGKICLQLFIYSPLFRAFYFLFFCYMVLSNSRGYINIYVVTTSGIYEGKIPNLTSIKSTLIGFNWIIQGTEDSILKNLFALDFKNCNCINPYSDEESENTPTLIYNKLGRDFNFSINLEEDVLLTKNSCLSIVLNKNVFEMTIEELPKNTGFTIELGRH